MTGMEFVVMVIEIGVLVGIIYLIMSFMKKK